MRKWHYNNLAHNLPALERTESRLHLGDGEGCNRGNGSDQRPRAQFEDLPQNPLHHPRPLSRHDREIHRGEKRVVLKPRHLQPRVGRDVAFADLDEAPEVSEAVPGFAELVARERVQDDVDAFVARRSADGWGKRRVAAVEDVRFGNAVFCYQQVLL